MGFGKLSVSGRRASPFRTRLTDGISNHISGRMMTLADHEQGVQVVLVHDRIETSLSSDKLHLGFGLGVLDRINLGGGQTSLENLLSVMTGRHLNVGMLLVETARPSQHLGWFLAAIRHVLTR